MQLKDYQGAFADYSKAIQLDPQVAGNYYNFGVAKMQLKDYQGAIADFSKAIQLDPQYDIAYNNREFSKGVGVSGFRWCLS